MMCNGEYPFDFDVGDTVKARYRNRMFSRHERGSVLGECVEITHRLDPIIPARATLDVISVDGFIDPDTETVRLRPYDAVFSVVSHGNTD